MIYHLFQALQDWDIPGAGLMTYLSFRAMLAAVLSMAIALFAGKKIIRFLQKKQIGETIRDLGLEGQLSKKGTPTMGGIIIIIAIAGTALLICDLTSIYALLLIFTTLWCGAIGLRDDYIKVFKHNKEGMSGKTKIILQVILGLIIGLTVWQSNDIVIRGKMDSETGTVYVNSSGELSPNADIMVENHRWSDVNVVKTTKTTIPFVSSHEFDYRSLSPFGGSMGWYAKWAIYVLMIVFVITGCSNGTNLTDGMDGLAAGTSAIVGVVLGVLAWLSGNIIDSQYLNIMYIPGAGEVAVFMSAFVGALIGFLWYNSYPAQVFMGDTGSLTIGGIIGVSAILVRKELLLPLLCGIFFVESLSVIIQRFWFKRTRIKYGEGQRVFKMSPLHHHFQKEGIPSIIQKPKNAIPEAKIVTRFWIIGLLLGVATLALLKVR
ncbi:MAG: phospho-N-acetylmuramoyl-pentapeptide-transferase [Bacteroidales bacterium]|nr:phospho-N-acetylmuramoyl-pentapeptide-transferase [Bacteroidales bacterium]MBR0298347.1 phospho-N-acetylmuramoyl-pentapeptide-transferase [Bacteroidales bacterium]